MRDARTGLGPDEMYEIVAVFDAQFPSRCRVDYDHKIRVGDRVARLQRSDNPMLPVTGVACSKCYKIIPRAQ